ncbi:cadherin-like beta sandwich domain-containing protein [Clostridium saccharoperbutylacetonicum]|uniref:cadherin-like beta sandwich domain-containing protein n=1 Tax=Clostridium saccharoperbutylacetonicum TaxID=36745 RepID=UPI000983C727|nr:cadherin-like beta sandwich domain-containing protein [Clostridium saccharoperbutylacetonicum]AQR97179.1 cadherin-like beta sandwich domain protein [Clostridium saccharoperbutylacetonicum]NSB33060.1 glucan-binding YG repeat protein [Clostridium saccharoperbutylacetonicum]
MNRKSIKKIISFALAFSLVTTAAPNVLNLGIKTAYAADSSGYITDVKLETNKDDNVYVYSKSSYNSKYKLSKIDGKAPTTLYAKVNSNVSKIKVTDIDLGTDCDKVKIYKSDTEIDQDEYVKISGNMTLKLKAYKGSDLKETYNLKIEQEDSDNNDNNNDDIYLDELTLSYNNDDIDFNFDKKKSSFDITVKNKVDRVKVYAKPEDTDYTVRINGDKVDDNDDWEDKVSLSEGSNTVTVKIKDDDSNEREYTLNITRESSTSNTNSSSTTSSTSGLNTSLGEGWQQIGADWFYIGPDGSKQTGWQNIGGRWYYMNENGVMQVGWIKSSANGKSYYLNPLSNGFKGALLQVK